MLWIARPTHSALLLVEVEPPETHTTLWSKLLQLVCIGLINMNRLGFNERARSNMSEPEIKGERYIRKKCESGFEKEKSCLHQISF